MARYMMENVMSSRLFNFLLLFTIVGEFFLPWVLGRYYKGYNSKTKVMSVLGSPQSPVRLIYNVWLIWLGAFLLFVALAYYFSTRAEFPILSILVLLSIGIFAVGAGVISGMFSVNETKDMATTASKIHGVGAAIGFMLLLFFPLLSGVMLFKQNDIVGGIVDISSFILSLIFFVCFVMGDKEQFQNSVLKYEGLWERLTLFFMYVPFVHKAINGLLS